MQNNKRYWLRGGVIGEVVLIIYVATTYLIGTLKIELHPIFNCIVAPCPSPDFYLGFYNFSFFELKRLLIFFAIVIVIIFIIGSILGWLYGKIRNRKLSKNVVVNTSKRN